MDQPAIRSFGGAHEITNSRFIKSLKFTSTFSLIRRTKCWFLINGLKSQDVKKNLTTRLKNISVELLNLQIGLNSGEWLHSSHMTKERSCDNSTEP